MKSGVRSAYGFVVIALLHYPTALHILDGQFVISFDVPSRLSFSVLLVLLVGVFVCA